MEFKPITAVWEITFECNMRCKHCGSKCDDKLADELTSDEVLDLCDQIGGMGLSYLTLSGGEPLVREDWFKIAAALKKNNVIPNMITNGWYIDEEILEKAKKAGISNIAISIDGLKENHDYLRRNGSFDRIMKAYDLMKKMGVYASAVTSVHKKNLPELKELKKVLIDKGVKSWQLQIAMPMGHFTDRNDLVIEPDQVNDIIDFAYEAVKEGGIIIDLADCTGYYSEKEVEVRRSRRGVDIYDGLWTGCPAGKFSFGIRANGDITGCNSIRDSEDKYYLEGNIREKSLNEMWTADDAFAWNRYKTKDKLTGFCNICAYGNLCLGGCTSVKQSFYSKLDNNEYCAYFNAVKKETALINKIEDINLLKQSGRKAIDETDYQLADLYLSRFNNLSPNSVEVINLLGLVNYKLENFKICKNYNEAVLKIEPENAYAHKGMGLVLAKLGDIEQGISMLKKAIELDSDFLDAYSDLALVLYQNGQYDTALKTLDNAALKSADFKKSAEKLYKVITKAINP